MNIYRMMEVLLSLLSNIWIPRQTYIILDCGVNNPANVGAITCNSELRFTSENWHVRYVSEDNGIVHSTPVARVWDQTSPWILYPFIPAAFQGR